MSEQVRFCPNCGSRWVEPDTSNRAEVYLSGGNPNKWQCNDCGYTGLMPEGDPENSFEENENFSNDKELEFEPEEKYPRNDTGFGKAYLKYILYISLPATLLYIFYITLSN